MAVRVRLNNKSEEMVDVNHPKLHAALTSYTRAIGQASIFKRTKKTALLDKRIRKMKIVYNEGSECYTNFNGIFIGMNFPYFQGNIDEVYNQHRIVSGHEMAHILFTSKTDWDRYVYRSKHRYKGASGLATDVLNILEDPRIERLMGKTNEFLKDGFYLMSHEITKEIPDNVNTQIAEHGGALAPRMKLGLLRSCLLYAARNQKIPAIKHEEIMDYLKKTFKYAMYAREANHTKDAVRAAEKIMELWQPLLNEYQKEREEDEEIEPVFRFTDVGSGTPYGNGDLEMDDEDGEGDVPEELKEKMKKMQEEAEEEMEMGGSSEINGDVLDFVDDITGNLEKSELLHQIQQRQSEILERAQRNMKAPVTAAILHELLESNDKSKKQQVKEKKESEKIKELDPNIDDEIHKGITAIFADRDEMRQFTRQEYAAIKRELDPIIRSAVKEIESIAQITHQRLMRRRRRGKLDKKLITQLAAFNDPKVFIKRKIEEEMMKMDVLLLVDVSGSNNAEVLNKKNSVHKARYVWNQWVAILLHEILKGVKFNHSVWTFYEGYGCEMSTAIDRSNCLEKDAGLYLKEIGAWGSNRDGFAIRYAGHYLNHHSEERKRLLFVLSDGQPAGKGYYGAPAMSDVKKQIEVVEQEGAKVIGIFSGSEEENEYFRKMYKNPVFVNNDNVTDLPRILKEIIIKEFQEYLNQF